MGKFLRVVIGFLLLWIIQIALASSPTDAAPPSSANATQETLVASQNQFLLESGKQAGAVWLSDWVIRLIMVSDNDVTSEKTKGDS